MPHHPTPISSAKAKIYYYGCTDIGLMRNQNEDAFGFFGSSGNKLPEAGFMPVAQSLIAVLSDGVGGHDGGDIASAHVVASTAQKLAAINSPGSTSADELEDQLQALSKEINAEILAMAAERNHQRGMAATLTAAWFLPDTLIAIHAGDSRLYRLRQGTLSQLTIDDTIAGRGLVDGSLTEEQARKHPKRHVLQNAVGIPSADFSVSIKQHSVEAGDVYLLCSDGLTDGLLDKDLAKAMTMVHDGEDAEEVLERLVDGANQGSGKDNITIQIIHYPIPVDKQEKDITDHQALYNTAAKTSKKSSMRQIAIPVLSLSLFFLAAIFFTHSHHTKANDVLLQKLETIEQQLETQAVRFRTDFDTVEIRAHDLGRGLEQLRGQLSNLTQKQNTLGQNQSGISSQLAETVADINQQIKDAITTHGQNLRSEFSGIRQKMDAQIGNIRSNSEQIFQQMDEKVTDLHTQLHNALNPSSERIEEEQREPDLSK